LTTPIRDAATLIMLRNRATAPSVLMGQRGKNAVFMPGKFVFPGGAVDANDAAVPLKGLNPTCAARLTDESTLSAGAIAAAAIRELWEETGQILGAPGNWAEAPQGWRGFAATGHLPHGAPLQFFFRAVTPAGRPRRFDARFFLADAADLVSDPDDFSGAEDELSHLQWVPLAQARQFDLAFITQVVLAELMRHITAGGPIATVPFFRNDDEDHLVTRLAGHGPLPVATDD
jgi:8-oxo-dGTP pyrophosphatase MutT (NUDIX family)